jgi:hypothetical protein
LFTLVLTPPEVGVEVVLLLELPQPATTAAEAVSTASPAMSRGFFIVIRSSYGDVAAASIFLSDE